MKKIEAIVRPAVVGAVRDALDRRGIGGLTCTEVLGGGLEPGHTGRYRGAAYGMDTHARVRLEVVAPDADAGPILHTIREHARTGEVGDGIVTVTRVEEAVRIRTGERGEAAVVDRSSAPGQPGGAAATAVTARAGG